MESLYPAIKQSHIFFISLSILIFNLKFFRYTLKPNQPLHWLWKVIPPSNDSLLLFTGMLMMTIAHWSPFSTAKWLGIKLLLVTVYIILGIFAMRNPPRSKKSIIFYVLAMIAVGSVVYLARNKPVLF